MLFKKDKKCGFSKICLFYADEKKDYGRGFNYHKCNEMTNKERKKHQMCDIYLQLDYMKINSIKP